MARFALVLFCALTFSWSAAASGTAGKRGDARDVRYATGWIAGVDELNDEIFLDDGKAFIVAPHINFQMLAPGLRVKLVYRTTSSGRKVQDILPLPPAPSPVRPMSGV